jgi:TrmH family RNA methyltransferase
MALSFDRFDISANGNPKLRALNDLLNDSNARKERGAFVFEGPHAFAEAVKSGAPVESLFVSPRFLSRPDSVGLVSSVDKYRFFTCTDGALSAGLAMPSHQGIAGVCKLPEGELPPPQAVSLLLAGVQDPGNLGALVRAADAFAAGPVLALKGGADPYGAKAVRASAGSLFRCWPRQIDLEELAGYLKKHSVTLYGCDAHGGAELGVIALQRPAMLAIGQEAAGLPKELSSLITSAVHLPLPGAAESLNAAQAGALALYLATR